MFCLKCGAIIQPGATVCPRCNAPVESKKTDNANSFKDYSKDDYRNDDFGKSYSADDYRKQEDSPKFQIKNDSFSLKSSEQPKFQVKSEGFSLKSPQATPTATPAQPTQPAYSQPAPTAPQVPSYSQPAATPLQSAPSYARPAAAQPAAPSGTPTWKVDSPDAPPTPLAAVPTPQPSASATSAGTPPTMYGQSNFGSYQPDTPREPINDHLGLAIFTTLCCCQIGGIISIVFSVKARNALQKGDYESAKSSAKTALWIAVISILLGLLLSFGSIILQSAAELGDHSLKSTNSLDEYIQIEETEDDDSSQKSEGTINLRERL